MFGRPNASVFAFMLGRPAAPVELKSGGLVRMLTEFVRRKGPFGLALGGGIGLWFLFTYGAGVAGFVLSLSGPNRTAAWHRR